MSTQATRALTSSGDDQGLRVVERGRGAGDWVSHCFVNEAVPGGTFKLVVRGLCSLRVRDGIIS